MVMRYVERNPVRARLVEHSVEWPWSSHQEASGIQSQSLLDKPPIELPAAWSQYVDTPFDNETLS